ncbi:MAG TPA: hypothetical protein VGK99_18825 [Acidobacteriota bacterium]
MQDDARARKARAARLQKKIDELVSSEKEEQQNPPVQDTSPRGFIQRRMRELDLPKKKS